MTRSLLIALCCIAIAGVAGWYFYTNHQHPVVTPTRATVVQAVYATGEVEPVYWSKVATQIAGKIEHVFVHEGDTIKQGQALAQLEDSVECAKAAEYLAELDYLKKEKQRYQPLLKKQFASKQKYEHIVSQYQATKAKLDAQNKVVARMQITSPMDGSILKRDVEPGEMIAPSDTIFWVGKLTPLRITAEVDEEDIAQVKIGQKTLIKADAFPDTPIEGTISEITPKGDPVDKDFRVRIALPGDTQLMVGMTTELNIIIHTAKNALLIPTSSVADGHVWVKENQKFNKHPITIGITDEENVQVLSGLNDGDEILAVPPKSPQ